jgi:hypothetical protein
MMLKIAGHVTAIGFAFCVSSALGQGLETMDSQKARSIAELLAVQAARIEAPQVKVDADPAHAIGLTYKKDGILAMPKKGLDEEEKDGNEQVSAQTGAGLGLLFMTSAFSPIVDGRPASADLLRTVKVVDGQGQEHTVTCLLLAVRRISDENWRLYVYGTRKKPLIDAAFDEVRRPDSGPIAIDVEDVSYSDGTLAITVFGKYKAGFRVAYRK